MTKYLKENFTLYCNSKNLQINQYQLRVIEKLQNYHNENFKSFFSKFFNKLSPKRSFYLYGGVGVGKTMILNFFFNQIVKKKQRLHFNEFMLNFHNFVHERKNENPESIIDLFVKDLKAKFDLIYFDEFQVTNIVDAMILGKLFENIFEANLKIILTSNTKISDLYKDGLQRDQFLPFIKIMEKNSIEHELSIEDDYRKNVENQKQKFFFPLNQETNFKINKFFRKMTKDKKRSFNSLNIKGRKLEIHNFYEGVIRFDFKDLCDQNLGAEDYLEITKISKYIVIENIPQFNDINSNQQQRFITLIDVIYDKNIPMAVTANQSLDNFSSSQSLEKPFKRTISRLYELTSKR